MSPFFGLSARLKRAGMIADAIDLPQTGRFAGREHRFALRVYFEDTDVSGIVYHANYLRFMERARSDMLRVAGVDQRAVMAAGGGAYAVRSIDLKYRAPARLDDALLVVSRVLRVRAAAVTIHQRVMRDDEVLTDATVEAAFMAANGRAKRQPAEWIDRFDLLIWEGD